MMPSVAVTGSRPRQRRPREEGCGEEGPLRAIFFAEFHPTLGPRIRCQAPREKVVISEETFGEISTYVIPKAEFMQRIMTANVKGYKVMGYPIVLQDNKYKRNEFMFNVCFVCYPWSRSAQHEPALIRLAEFLRNLELDCEFLSKEESSEELLPILDQILEDLNTKQRTQIEVQGFSFEARVVHQKPDPRPIGDHEVPVLMADVNSRHFDWDLTTQQILPYFNGLNHVAKIAQLADVNSGLVKSCVQNLRYHQIVRMVPIFQFCNDYCSTSKLPTLVSDKTLQSAMLENCTADGEENPPPFGEVYRLITEMRHGTTLKDLCIRFKVGKAIKLNIYKLVQFLCVHGIIRRIHKKPFYEKPHSDSSLGIETQTAASAVARRKLFELCDGTRTMDEICVNTGLSTRELMEFCSSEPNLHLL